MSLQVCGFLSLLFIYLFLFLKSPCAAPAIPKVATPQGEGKQFAVLPLLALRQDKRIFSGSESQEHTRACNQTRCSLT